MSKPFAGIRILDFTRYVAGPFGTYQFALLGAEVIKVEPKAGDDMRRSSPVRWEGSAHGLGPSFLGINANKRSITLDLAKPAAVEIAKRLATDADIVWENFRPGIMERFGLGYEVLRQSNPRLIYCAVSGFGQNGPERGTAAFDGKLQAMSGIMSITGHEDKGPTRAGFALCDTIGAMTAAFAVSSALFQRTQTGAGQFVDVAMLDAALSFISGQVAEYTVTGHIHRQFGNLSSTGKVTRQPLQGWRRRFDAGGDDRAAVCRPDAWHRPRRRARRFPLHRLALARAERAGPARHHRRSAGRRCCEKLGEAANRSRCALRRDLADFRNRASPAIGTSRRAAACRGVLRRIHPGRLRPSPRRGRHRQHRAPAAADRRTHRPDPARRRR